ncbi:MULTISPECIES: DUF3598 family protein [unclassified Moorena]|uniref:DUF3598 family protein n=1 Tax=unclassified Moorena TaxID=2683338 RepID=UPI0013FF4090|nr:MULTISPECIES: DUF3598 family protein [unclassified Moorena]NEO15355.1 DUF3598 family protein [Moorena sp. SIO3E8]NEQ02561.1 DUF3598 family protein [Moorena sp. SIO3F7]
MDRKLQNWKKFCRYYSGDLYGIWTRYSTTGDVIESWRCIRSFRPTADCREIHQQNHYTYASGNTETKTFGPYKQPITTGLFLDNGFSWGSTKVKSGSTFFSDICLRSENSRATAIAKYDESGSLKRFTVFPEHLGHFVNVATLPPAHQISSDWQGTVQTITPDWQISAPIVTSWQPLDDLPEDYLRLHFTNGISISCPAQVESGKAFFVAVDWLVNQTLLQRGTRHYDQSGFTSFTVEVFRI